MPTFISRRGGAEAPRLSPVARVGHVYLDTRQRVLYCLNETAREMLAEGVPLTPEALTKCPLRTLAGELVPAKDLPLVRAWQSHTAQEATYLYTPEQGRSWHLTWNAVPLHDAESQLIGVLASLSLGNPEPDWQYLAGLAHDLRTPLQTIRLVTVLLEQTPMLHAEGRELLERLRSSTDRALSIGMDLLEWCRTPVVGRRTQLAWFPLEPFLGTLVSEHQPAAQRKGILLIPDLAEAREQEILCDMIHLGRLVSNLLTNAIRYTPRGEVRLHAGWRTDAAGKRESMSLSVIDTGTGIAAEDQESIFQPYERGRAGKEGESGGSGIGLSVVDRLVEELGLTLDIYSEYGQGSCFELLVPASLLRTRESAVASADRQRAAPVRPAP